VHEHRRLGVPVRLGADVDAGDDDVDLPAGLVNSMIRRSARDTQSMFSVPLSIEMRAPEDSANHSTGMPRSSARSSAATTRAHSGSATVPRALVGSPRRATRVIPSG
jgi:hypothetical protein